MKSVNCRNGNTYIIIFHAVRKASVMHTKNLSRLLSAAVSSYLVRRRSGTLCGWRKRQPTPTRQDLPRDDKTQPQSDSDGITPHARCATEQWRQAEHFDNVLLCHEPFPLTDFACLLTEIESQSLYRQNAGEEFENVGAKIKQALIISACSCLVANVRAFQMPTIFEILINSFMNLQKRRASHRP